MNFGPQTSEPDSFAIMDRALEHGINFFDTANAYNTGEGERMLGRCLRDFPRSSLFVITKVFAEMGPGPNDQGLSKKHIFEQCHESLRRLGMDYIDLYMCHRPDPDTPLEETIRAMEDLARMGKILYWGVSEWPAELMVEANALARQMGARPIGVNQPRYSLLYRYPERSVFPTTAREGIGNVIFSGLAHGMLTGKYLPGQPPPTGSRGADDDTNMVLQSLYLTEANKVRCQSFVEIAHELGTPPAALALAWVLRRTEVTSAIIGATSANQIRENVKAVDLTIPDEVVSRLDSLFPMPEFGL